MVECLFWLAFAWNGDGRALVAVYFVVAEGQMSVLWFENENKAAATSPSTRWMILRC